MERLTFGFAALVVGLSGLLVSCAPAGPQGFDPRFSHVVTALLITSYEEDSATKRFVRSTAWGSVPEKLVPDGLGGYTVAVPLILQSETSDGPQPDRFWTVLVRVLRAGDQFTLSPNEALPGPSESWHDPSQRTVWFRGPTWQFQGRY